jgi:hypothetical protein
MADMIRFLYSIGAARMVENEFCTCAHHLIVHDENAERCTAIGCRCSAFNPEVIPLTVTPESLIANGKDIQADIAKLMTGLHGTGPLHCGDDSRSHAVPAMKDALVAAYALQARIRLLQYALHYQLQKLGADSCPPRVLAILGAMKGGLI